MYPNRRPDRSVSGTTRWPASSASSSSASVTRQLPAPRIRRASASITPTMLSCVVAALMVSDAAATCRRRSDHACWCASDRLSASSAWRSSVTSRKTRTAPRTSFDAPWMAAAESAIGCSVPSRAMSSVWFASPTITPSRSARVAGFSTGCRVSSLTIRNTCSSGAPTASAYDQPVSCSVTRLIIVMQPAASVTITPSPMLASVTRSCSRSAKSAAAAEACCAAFRRTDQMKPIEAATPSRPVAMPLHRATLVAGACLVLPGGDVRARLRFDRVEFGANRVHGRLVVPGGQPRRRRWWAIGARRRDDGVQLRLRLAEPRAKGRQLIPLLGRVAVDAARAAPGRRRTSAAPRCRARGSSPRP